MCRQVPGDTDPGRHANSRIHDVRCGPATSDFFHCLVQKRVTRHAIPHRLAARNCVVEPPHSEHTSANCHGRTQAKTGKLGCGAACHCGSSNYDGQRSANTLYRAANPSPEAIPEALQSRRVANRGRFVRHISIQIRVASRKADGVLAEPSAYLGIIPPVEVVLEGGGVVEGAAGEGEEVVEGGVGFGEEVAVGVEGAVVGDGGLAGGGVALHQVADRAEVVGEWPEDVAGRGEGGDLFIGEDLVDGGAPEVAVGELRVALGVVVELQDNLADVVGCHCRPVEGDGAKRAVVNEVRVLKAKCAIPIGVDRAGDPAVEVVVGVLDDLRGRAGFALALRDADQAVAVVPFVFGDLAPLALVDFAVRVGVGPDVAEGAVAFRVVLVPVRAVGEELVIVVRAVERPVRESGVVSPEFPNSRNSEVLCPANSLADA